MENVLDTLQLQASSPDLVVKKLQLGKESYTELTMQEMSDVNGGTTPLCVVASVVLISALVTTSAE